MLGIGGAGMSGIARILAAQGHRVSGTDLQMNSACRDLAENGIKVMIGHSPDNLDPDVDLVVYSSAVPASNAEMMEAGRRGIATVKRGDMLARIVENSHCIAVAGAHGKTTISSMISMALEQCGCQPSFVVGGNLQGTNTNAALGAGKYFVIEADESDASFLALSPYIAVVSNIEGDHLEYYQSVEKISEAFISFIGQTRPGGFALLCGDDPGIKEIRTHLTVPTIFYGEHEDNDYRLTDWQPQGRGSRCLVYRHGECLGSLELTIPGRHNSLNALAAVAVGMECGQGFADLSAALNGFRGAQRRFEIVGETEGITIVDDYAHHPTEVCATIKAARHAHAGRLTAVFQPHRYTRTERFFREFGSCFGEADRVILTDVYSAGEAPIAGVSGELIFKETRRLLGERVSYIPDKNALASFILGEVRTGDMVLCMGAGDIWKTASEVAAALSEA
ncbi:MAG: UDP-N-acetylmuramate--L-alanine ligase [Syntrophomonadaceae bacterium]|nr:UDP-N-acetylmuramate--L-alanine ligase [Syntrophomonadaceae bacterium]